MEKQWKFYLRSILEHLSETNYIRPNDLPNIELYMDQVTTFLDDHLEQSKRFDNDKLLTKTMINNYTKSELLPSPVKKKYSKDHMYLLVFIYYLKNFLSINDVKHIVGPMKDMFVGKDAEISLEEIYQEIFDIESKIGDEITKDVMAKFDKSKRTFSEVKGADEKEFLSIFSFIAMLSIDVYLKKQIIERIIDDLLVPAQETRMKEAEQAKKEAEQAEKEAREERKAGKKRKDDRQKKGEENDSQKSEEDETNTAE